MEEADELAKAIVKSTLEAMDGRVGDDPIEDAATGELIAEDLLERSARYQQIEDGADIAAAILVSGADASDDIGSQAHPGAADVVRTASASVRAAIAQAPPSRVKQAYEQGFRLDPAPGSQRI